MRKFIMIMLTLVLCCGVVNAQRAVETSKFTDNISVTLQGGIVTGFDDMFGHISPTITLGVDKYITPAFGVGIEARTAIAAPSGALNPPTAFDAVNVGGNFKVNILNLIKFNGTKRTFEPVAYVGLGWGHSSYKNSLYPWIDINGVNHAECNLSEWNYMTFRTGVEFNVNLGKEKAWAIVVNPSFVWGNIRDMRLNNHRGNFEINAGVRYNFKNSNGTRTFKLYDITALNSEINNLREENEYLKNRKPEVIKEVKVIAKEFSVERITVVTFAQGSDELSTEAKTILNNVKAPTVMVVGYASPEGTEDFNKNLSSRRASNVADYLKNKGIRITSCEGKGAVDNNSNRIVYIIAQ